ncbi:3-hydroxyanthranilic acid dioxygenase [Aspergillus transmontanensis]|uniref:3-hydroxyanthranilic acid dioxygenase n=1 Tax=Aspergillus transmontanensis TaxID=1034304 RepID=A0A5N6VKE7_9EURO|nr:3-hydroxyanthranilic acid dioxygenase [Aspergillus transmontanensis]
MSTTNGLPIPGPLQLTAWLEKNSASLQPPVNNKCLYSGEDFILMAVGGPNRRKDYHSRLTRMNAYSQPNRENGDQFRDVVIREGEMFLLPGNIPHSPRRQGDTIGLVMERKRPVGSIDRLRWYCENEKEHGETPALIREEQFFCENMETQLKDVIEDWMRNESSRECKLCGSIAAA